MNNLEVLKANLARAGIPSKVSNRAFLGNVTGRIVQMDILKNGKREELRISVPEGDEAEVKVLGIDPTIQQAVLMVHEPERAFVERVWNPDKREHEDVVRKTSEEKRRFLVGMDECHLFVAQLTSPATSVKQAHEGLRPRDVPAGKAAKKLKVVRQGEWFFQPATDQELRQIERHAKAYGVERNVRIGRGRGSMRGRPHVVSESVLLVLRSTRTPVVRNGRTVGEETTRETLEFAKGHVRHPDHRVVDLAGWHKVFMNTEDRATLSRFTSWVD